MIDPIGKVPLSKRYRLRRAALFRTFVEALLPPDRRTFRIVDLGGTPAYWMSVGADFLEAANLEITCINQEEAALADGQHPRISREFGDACALKRDDHSFDLVHSNSVIEHVGSFTNMQRFAGEVRRLAPAYYVQTPYQWFPIDPHFYRVPFFHWMPLPMQARLLGRFPMSKREAGQDLATRMARVESRFMLDAQQFRHLFPDAEHSFERAFGLPKSMIAQRSGKAG